MTDWITIILTALATGFGSSLGNYIATKHLIEKLEKKDGIVEKKHTLITDLKNFSDYILGGIGGKGGDAF